MRSRKIGVLTLGISLVAFGVLFLVRVFAPWFDYVRVLQFWPVVLILLGIEVLLAALLPKKDGEPTVRLDATSVILLFVTLFLACGLAAAQFALEQLPELLDRTRDIIFH